MSDDEQMRARLIAALSSSESDADRADYLARELVGTPLEVAAAELHEALRRWEAKREAIMRRFGIDDDEVDL